MQIRQQGSKVQLIKLKDTEAEATETTEKKARKSSEVVLSINTDYWQNEIEQILLGDKKIDTNKIAGLDRIEDSEKLTEAEKKVAAKELKSIFTAKIETARKEILTESSKFLRKINAAVQVEAEKGTDGNRYRIMTLLGILEESVEITKKAKTIIINAQNSNNN